MNKLCIYGCGGLGREIADLANAIGSWSELIFINDYVNDRIVNNIPVFTFREVLNDFSNEEYGFVVAIGEPLFREKIYDKLTKNHCKLTKIIAPAVNISKYSEIQKGTIIHVGATITCNVIIRTGCYINKHVVIGHDVDVGNYTVISPNATIGGNVKIGAGVYIGSGAIIREGLTIGDNAIIGMGAVVLRDVPESDVVVGNPAKKLRENTSRKVF